MRKKDFKVAYEAPELFAEAVDIQGILCESWTDGSIGDDLVNDFGNA